MDSVNAVKETLLKNGASMVGFANISVLDNPIAKEFPYAISVAVALDKDVVAQILRGPTPAYYDEYVRVNEKLKRLSEKCRKLITYAGYKSASLAATHLAGEKGLSSPLPHKTAATLSGIGWIGKCDLLVTKEFGSAVRLTTIPTDMPLKCGEPITESQCGPCSICMALCPGKAVKGKLWKQGMAREELYDAEACRESALRASKAVGIDTTLCGICMANCPWTLRYIYG